MKKRLIGYCRDHLKFYFAYCEKCKLQHWQYGYSWGQRDVRRSIEANLLAEYKKYNQRIGHQGYAQICHNIAQQIRKKDL